MTNDTDTTMTATDAPTDSNHNDTASTTATDDATGSKPDWWGDLDDGERADAIVDSSQTERHYLRADGKRYWFDMREIPWQKRSGFVDDALVLNRNSRELDTTQYYRDALDYAVVDASIPIENWATFMSGAKSELGDKLTAEVPGPARSVEEDEEGNSDEPSDQDKAKTDQAAG